jgi:hypothetical protein
MKITQDSFAATYRQIIDLMGQEKWVDAHRACIEILRFDPENIKIIRLKNKIESKVRKQNINAIKSDLKQIMPLYKAKKYPVLMDSLRLLEPYINEYKPLKRFAIKVEKEYQNFISGEREKIYSQDLNSIKDLINKKKFQEGIRLAERLRIRALHSREVLNLILDIRRKWVDNEIESKKSFLAGDKWDDITLFYQGLFRIDEKSAKLKTLIESAKKNAKQKRIEEKRDFIYSGLEKIKTLFQLKKFESAMIAANEILMIDPENTKAQVYAQKAIIRVKKLIDRELLQQMVSTIKNTKQDYKINKKNYIRL